MTPALRQQILDALWPPGQASPSSVWAVLDCARDPVIYRLLLESRLEFLCLYSGKLPRELEMVAPHMVELLPGHRFTQRLLDEGWGRAWGVFATLDDPTMLRHHLRRFLVVRDEQGRRLLFRFFDPRVLGVFLRTCDPDQLRSFFGPLRTLLAEQEGGALLAEFGCSGDLLSERTIAADPNPAPRPGVPA